jgi:hypothetical protein
MAKLVVFFYIVLIVSIGALIPPFIEANASAPVPTDVWKPLEQIMTKAPVPKAIAITPVASNDSEYLKSRGYQLVKSKIGGELAKLAYNEVLKHQRDGVNIDLTMWYTLVNYRENPNWNFKASHRNPNGTWDCGGGQINMPICTKESLSPYWNIPKSISILASKSKMVGGAKWHAFKRYNGGGRMAEAYATVCWSHYTRLTGQKGA